MTDLQDRLARLPELHPIGGGAPMDTGQYITVKDAAVRLGISRQRVHQYIQAGRLAAVQVGEGEHRVWLVNRDGLHLLDRQAPGRPRKV